MAYLTESQVRRAAENDPRVIAKSFRYEEVLRESTVVPITKQFDIFLSHSSKDAKLVQGTRRILEQQGKSVYVDWIDDRQLDREKVTPATANVLRQRMRNSKSLLYIYTRASKGSRWMPWELGYFDAFNGNVAVLPVTGDAGEIDFTKEEYVGLYPKVELVPGALIVNRTKGAPVPTSARNDWSGFGTWVNATDKLRMAS